MLYFISENTNPCKQRNIEILLLNLLIIRPCFWTWSKPRNSTPCYNTYANIMIHVVIQWYMLRFVYEIHLYMLWYVSEFNDTCYDSCTKFIYTCYNTCRNSMIHVTIRVRNSLIHAITHTRTLSITLIHAIIHFRKSQPLQTKENSNFTS